MVFTRHQTLKSIHSFISLKKSLFNSCIYCLVAFSSTRNNNKERIICILYTNSKSITISPEISIFLITSLLLLIILVPLFHKPFFTCILLFISLQILLFSVANKNAETRKIKKLINGTRTTFKFTKIRIGNFGSV